jgi:hypothetical protein
MLKKMKLFGAAALACFFLVSVSMTSCGGKKEEATEQTESAEQPAEAEHPTEGGEHPTEGGEHPAADTTAKEANG